MDFDYGEEDVDFGRQLVAWLRDNLPPEWRRTHARNSTERFQFQKSWDQKLFAGGWAPYTWPVVEEGRTAPTPTKRMIYADIMGAYGAPEGLKTGKRLVAPILSRYGTEAQKARFLGPIFRGEEAWCQGFSEPDAGSDLASLKTKAVREGSSHVITGQKVWTSFAHGADWCLLLARTNPEAPKHRGISVFLVDMRSPGVTTRPIRQINGGEEFSEVFLDRVVVPESHLLGGVDDGWSVAMSLLAHERGVDFAFEVIGKMKTQNLALAHALRAVGQDDDPVAALSLGRAQAESLAAHVNTARLALGAYDRLDLGGVASALRLQASSAEAKGATEALYTTPFSAQLDPHRSSGLVQRWLNARSSTIASGTAEIQRNIVAHRLYGLK